jgi:hypothetical protein
MLKQTRYQQAKKQSSNKVTARGHLIHPLSLEDIGMVSG